MQYDEEDVADVVSAVQTGDFEVIQDVISRNFIDASVCDKDGCSLLHWAAINNRYEIAEFLIENGAKVNAVGGVLCELPLAWAVRKKFHAMVHLLLKNNSDVNHLSRTKLSVLHLALKLGDVDLVYLLLHYGADPNCADGNGDPIAIWILKARHHPYLYVDYMRLLLNHDCNLTTSVEAATGNTVLHLLTEKAIRSSSGSSSSGAPSPASPTGASGRSSSSSNSNAVALDSTGLSMLDGATAGLGLGLGFVDADAATVIAMACDKGGVDASVFEARNKDGQTPFQMAWQSHHAGLVKLFFDLWLLQHTPRWLPITAAATATMFLFKWLRHFGPLSWAFWLCMVFIDGGLIAILTQASLTHRLGRVAFGASLGMVGSVYMAYLVYIEELLAWEGCRTVAVVCLVCTLLAMVVFYNTPAARLVNTSHVSTISSISVWGSAGVALSGASASASVSRSFFSRAAAPITGSSAPAEATREEDVDEDGDADIESGGGDASKSPLMRGSRASSTASSGGEGSSACTSDAVIEALLLLRHQACPGAEEADDEGAHGSASPMKRTYSGSSAASPGVGDRVRGGDGDRDGYGGHDGSFGGKSNSVNNFEALCGSAGGGRSTDSLGGLQRSGSLGSLHAPSPRAASIRDGVGGKAGAGAGAGGRRDFKLCTGCLVNAKSASMHCPCCNACVVDVDHHCDFLGNCVGRGNRRMYCVVLLLGIICCVLFAVGSFLVQFNGGGGSSGKGAEVENGVIVENFYRVCYTAYGEEGDRGSFSLLWEFIMVQRCVLEMFPCLSVLTWGCCAAAVQLTLLLYRQLLYVVHKTSTLQVSAASSPTVLTFRSLSREVVFNALSKFAWSGAYRMTRGGTGAQGR